MLVVSQLGSIRQTVELGLKVGGVPPGLPSRVSKIDFLNIYFMRAFRCRSEASKY